MIRGKTNSNLEATVVVGFQDPQGGFQSFECILDTGYDGEMALPTEAIQRLGLTPSGNRIITQVDGYSLTITCSGRGNCSEWA